MSHPVSGYMIVWNEEASIRASVLSILQYVDELVILDGRSKDRTLPIIRQMAGRDNRIKLIIRPQQGGRYSDDWQEPHRRNWCAQKVTYDWVLTIDADELLDDLPANYFREADNELIFNTINMLNRTEYIEQYKHDTPDAIWLVWYPDPHVRYFNRKRYNYNDTPLHCYLKNKNGEHSIQFATHSNHDIWHYHAVVKKDRMLDNESARQRMVVKPIWKALPKHDSLFKVRL